MDEQNQDALSRRNLRRSACDLCREYKVKCSGNRPKCDRCSRLAKDCIFSLARSRPTEGQDARVGSRPGSKSHDRFIHVDPAVYRTNNNDSSSSSSSNNNNNNNNGSSGSNMGSNTNNSQEATKERPPGPTWRQSHDGYGDDPRPGAFHAPWPDTLPPLHHHHLPAGPMPSAAPAPDTRPPSQAALDRDVEMAFSEAERASSFGPSEAHLSVSDEGWYWNNVPDFGDHAYSGSSSDIYRAMSNDFALMVPRGGGLLQHEDGDHGNARDKSKQQQQQPATRPPDAPTHALSVSALRTHSSIRRTDSYHQHHHHRGPSTTGATASSSSAASRFSSSECSCVQQLTLSLFDLSTWKADHQRPGHADSPTLSEYLIIYRNSVNLWQRLTLGCVRCLERPQFAQLLILNVEQLVHLQRNQQAQQQQQQQQPPRAPTLGSLSTSSASASSPPSPSPGLSDVITIGNFVVESDVEKAAIIGPLLKVRAAGLVDLCDSLRELLLPTGMPDLGARLDSIMDKLESRGPDGG